MTTAEGTIAPEGPPFPLPRPEDTCCLVGAAHQVRTGEPAKDHPEECQWPIEKGPNGILGVRREYREWLGGAKAPGQAFDGRLPAKVSTRSLKRALLGEVKRLNRAARRSLRRQRPSLVGGPSEKARARQEERARMEGRSILR